MTDKKIQTVFTESTYGLTLAKTEHNMGYKQLKNRAETIQTLRRDWDKISGICPYCLYVGVWSDFAQKLPDQTLSKMMKCPTCGNEMRQKMLSKFSKNTSYGYGEWFWISWYNWGEKFKPKVRPTFDTLKKRLWSMGISNEFWRAQRNVKNGVNEAYNETKRLDKGIDEYLDDGLEDG